MQTLEARRGEITGEVAEALLTLDTMLAAPPAAQEVTSSSSLLLSA